MTKNKKFWNWKNQAQDESEPVERVLEIYGTIAEDSWFEDDVTPAQFRDELFAGTGNVTIWLNSPGGDTIAASQIYSMLMDYPYDVTVKIDGLAASAASVIAMAGTQVLMAPTAMMFIHNPSTGAFGDHKDMEKVIEMLSEVKESIINAYELRTGLSRAQLSHMMENETWMNAKKAVELGFADAYLEDRKRKCENLESYSFSASMVENAILNKISVKARKSGSSESISNSAPISASSPPGSVPVQPPVAEPEPKEEPVTAPIPEQEPAHQPNNLTPHGRSVDVLMERLNLLRH